MTGAVQRIEQEMESLVPCHLMTAVSAPPSPDVTYGEIFWKNLEGNPELWYQKAAVSAESIVQAGPWLS